MPTSREILGYYEQPSAMTAAGRHAGQLEALPRGVPELVRIVQGLLLHEHWAPAYGVALSEERRSGSHVRPVAEMLDRTLALDARPLAAARPLEKRLVGVCRHFTVLLVAMLRAQGVPARARCGFGTYFNAGTFEDHWVCEYWNSEKERWILVDSQIDELARDKIQPDFDPQDVPRDRFVIAGDAWSACRAGRSDPAIYGIFDLRGLWFIAGNVLRDVAALNHRELLPWDSWGAMTGPGEPIPDATLTLLDRAAALTHTPDATFAELRALYEQDDRLRLPATVYNALRSRPEPI